MAKWLGALVGLGGVCVATSIQAQTYPARPVTIVVTAAAGGLTDLVARGIGQQGNGAQCQDGGSQPAASRYLRRFATGRLLGGLARRAQALPRMRLAASSTMA